MSKTRPTFQLEDKHSGFVCGLDEVGRGPLAGPVTAACVYVPQDVRTLDFWNEVNDSKKVAVKKRDALFDLIQEHCVFGIAEATAEEIDEINILQACLLAMKRAHQAMNNNFGIETTHALVDGKFIPKLACKATAVIKGDSVSLSIAAASILAKVTRDRLMQQLHQQFPMYGWITNAGYGTAAHLEGLQSNGVTEHHRRSFAPVAACIK